MSAQLSIQLTGFNLKWLTQFTDSSLIHFKYDHMDSQFLSTEEDWQNNVIFTTQLKFLLGFIVFVASNFDLGGINIIHYAPFTHGK